MNHANPKKLLIVDDEPGVREGLAFVGELADMQVVEACSGKEAVEVLSKPGHDIGVILSDRVMPEMNGAEFLKWVNRSGSNIPFIFITGLPSTDFTVQAFQLGAFDCLEKPFRIGHVSKIIDASQKYQQQFEALSSKGEESFVTSLRVEASLCGLKDAAQGKPKDFMVDLLFHFKNIIKTLESPVGENVDLSQIFRSVHHLQSFYCRQHELDEWPLGAFILKNLAHLRVHQQVGERLRQSLLEAISLAERWVSESDSLSHETNTFLKQFAA